MYKYIATLACVLSGCGTAVEDFVMQKHHDEESDPRTVQVDDGLNTRMRSLSALIGRDPSDIRIGFGDLDGLAGVCRWWTGSRTWSEIAIDNKFYANSEEKQVDQVILHEIGHCLLGRDHKDEHDADGYPVSIMRSYAFSRWEIKHYVKELDSYLKELTSE